MAPSKLILVASTRKCKVGAVCKIFPNAQVISAQVDSGVSSQPIGTDETFLGATNRLEAILKMSPVPPIDYYVAIESGLIKFGPRTYVDMAVVIMQDKEGNRVTMTSAGVQAIVTDELDIAEYTKAHAASHTPDVAFRATGGLYNRMDNVETAVGMAYANLMMKT